MDEFVQQIIDYEIKLQLFEVIDARTFQKFEDGCNDRLRSNGFYNMRVICNKDNQFPYTDFQYHLTYEVIETKDESLGLFTHNFYIEPPTL